MSTIVYTVVTTVTFAINMNMPNGTISTRLMNGTATTQVQSTKVVQTKWSCHQLPQIDESMVKLKRAVESTKVAKIISMECIE